MLLPVAAALFWFAKIALASDSCALQLEQAIFKPKFCGFDYFEGLSCKLNAQLRHLDMSSFNPLVARLCLQFSAENQVQLSLLNAQGIDMCTLNDPTANLMYLITQALNVRSSSDRYSIYTHYLTNPPNPALPLPPANSPDLDSIGMFYVYLNITNQALFVAPGSAETYSLGVLDYVNSYPIAGQQASTDLQNIGLFGVILASVTASEFPEFLASLNHALGITPFYQTSDFGGATAQLLWQLVMYSTTNDDGELPLNIRVNNYQTVQTTMLGLQGTSGIVNSFAQSLPVNTLENGLCQFGYNLLLPYGKMTRVIFGQTDIFFKKK